MVDISRRKFVELAGAGLGAAAAFRGADPNAAAQSPSDTPSGVTVRPVSPQEIDQIYRNNELLGPLTAENPGALSSLNAYYSFQANGSGSVVADLSGMDFAAFNQTFPAYSTTQGVGSHLFDGTILKRALLDSTIPATARYADFEGATIRDLPTDVTGSNFTFASFSPPTHATQGVLADRAVFINTPVGLDLGRFSSLKDAVVLGAGLTPGEIAVLTDPANPSTKGIITTPEQLAARMNQAAAANGTLAVDAPYEQFQHLRKAADYLLNNSTVQQTIGLSGTQKAAIAAAARQMDNVYPEIALRLGIGQIITEGRSR